MALFATKTWVGEVNPLGPPANPATATSLNDTGMNDLEQRAVTAFNNLTLTGTAEPSSLEIGQTYFQLDGNGQVVAEFVGGA